jgi:hypothetical protein
MAGLSHGLRTVQDIVDLVQNPDPDESFHEQDLRDARRILNMEWTPTETEVRQCLVRMGHISD